MKPVALIALVLAGFADIVPGTGAVMALLAGAMAVWAAPGALGLSLTTIAYNILSAALPAPGFVLADLLGRNAALAGGPAGAPADPVVNVWLVVLHAGLLVYALKRYRDYAGRGQLGGLVGGRRSRRHGRASGHVLRS